MKSSKIVSIVCGIGIIVATIVMIIRLGEVAQEYQFHSDWSLGAVNAIKITAQSYGAVICFFTIILVVINVLKKSN